MSDTAQIIAGVFGIHVSGSFMFFGAGPLGALIWVAGMAICAALMLSEFGHPYLAFGALVAGFRIIAGAVACMWPRSANQR